MSINLPALPPEPGPNEPWADRLEWAKLAMQRAMVEAQVGTGLELAADLPPRRISKAEVILACISVVPPTIRPTEAAWASDVMTVGNALWARMQADPEINPPSGQ